MSAAMGLFLGAQERVRNSRGKRAISVRATEVPLYSFWFAKPYRMTIVSVKECYIFMCTLASRIMFNIKSIAHNAKKSAFTLIALAIIFMR